MKVGELREWECLTQRAITIQRHEPGGEDGMIRCDHGLPRKLKVKIWGLEVRRQHKHDDKKKNTNHKNDLYHLFHACFNRKKLPCGR